MLFVPEKRLKPFYASMMIVYCVLLICGLFSRAGWLVDDIVAIGLLTLMYFMSSWLLVGLTEFAMFNFALLLHVLGALGLYATQISFIAYDNIMHFTAMFVVAYLSFNFISRKLHIKHHENVKRTVVDDHKIIFIFLVLATVTMLGTVVELVEFTGYLLGESGNGILVPWDGISDQNPRFSNPYIDTLEDIFVNILGGIVGVFVFYKFKYENDCWMCRRS